MPTSIKYFDVDVPSAGVISDKLREDIGMKGLHSAENFVYIDGAMRVRNGFLNVVTADLGTGAVTGIFQYDYDTENKRTVIATVNDAYHLVSTDTANKISPAVPLTNDPSALVQFRVFRQGTPGKNYLLYCNGADKVHSWSGDPMSVLVPITGSPESTCMMTLGRRLILGGISGTAGLGVTWSSLNDFTAGWGTNDVLLNDTPGRIIAMCEMGNHRGVVYKEDAIYVCLQQTGTIAFSFQMKKAGVPGPASRLSVVPLPNGAQMYLGRDASVYLFDGETVQSCGRHIQKHISDTWDKDRYNLSFGVYDGVTGLVWFFFCCNGGAGMTTAVCINPNDMSLWPQRFNQFDAHAGAAMFYNTSARIGDMQDEIGDVSDTIGSILSQRRCMMIGTGSADLLVHDGYSDNGNPIIAKMETGSSSLGDNVLTKTLHEMCHRFRQCLSGEATVTVGTSDHGEDIDWSTPGKAFTETINLTSSGPKITGYRLTAKFFAMKIEAASTDEVVWLGSSAAVSARSSR